MPDLEFVARFNSVPVPDSLRTIDAIDPRVEELQDDYFNRTIASFHLSQQAIGATFEVIPRMLVPLNGSRESDDFLVDLWFRGVQPIAGVLNVRDERNYQVTHFTKYPFLPESIRNMQQIIDHFSIRD